MANNNDLELGEVDIVRQTVQFLLASCEEKGHDRVYQPSIFKIPRQQRDISPNSYNPRVVSIGPLHREATNLQAMEVRKPTYLHNLLACLELPREQTLETCVEKVTASINKIKGSYDEIKSYTHLELAQMMVMDAFFILDFLYNYLNYFLADLLLFQSILYDLMLLENQIPFFVLQDIFECTILIRKPTASLIRLILDCYNDIHLFGQELREDNVLRGTTPDHILGVLRKCYQPEKSIRPKFTEPAIHSAAELDRAGVKFRPSQDPSWPMAIEFESSRFGCFSWIWGKPTLILPVMRFHDQTESLIRNLVVYEQSSSLVPNYITSYIVALDSLVDTKEDIAMLMESGVFTNFFGSNQEAANIINNIAKGIPWEIFFYSEQLEKLDEYYNGYWPRNMARLRRTYFNSPWSIIALIAGIVLFALTIVQTIFTIKAV